MQEDAPAQFYLGQMYYLGKGVGQDYNEAAKWFRKAAMKEDDKAQAFLGQMYFVGQGVARDFKEAAKWYREAAKQGNPDAKGTLDLLCRGGIPEACE
ncbi:tetratricopeptide repeat protein [Desulforhopalus singaporensis]|uniref:Sel1 repeat-containing protein n=1 Tax=Desulforhopalus singaporensis TaxID=91360 RepID=A0A1H0RFZ3_9BACT|nr:tetratricopeptide repeat protein [Desulforhopalus singaporensis]SDP27818.1 Sel1 repeat-containing protein [Desulforhopalus singaporensis]